MTSKQLKSLESDLEKRGYKKWTNCLVGGEDYSWFKTFGEHKDKNGDSTSDYQIAFRVYDCQGKCFNHPKQSEIWLTVTMILTCFNVNCNYSWQIDVPDIDMCEAMMKEIFNTAKRYMK